MRRTMVSLAVTVCLMVTPGLLTADNRPADAKKDTWASAMQTARQAVQKAADRSKAAESGARRLMAAFPLESDWLMQDTQGPLDAWLLSSGSELDQKAIAAAVEELGAAGMAFRDRLERLVRANTSTGDPQWLDLYGEACQKRREIRLRPLVARWPRLAFAKHYPMGGSHYAYTEGLSDAQAERHFSPGTALCLIELDGAKSSVRTLIDDPKGVIRDVDVSYDGKKILFSWKKSDRDDDYHLYEMDAQAGAVRQLTFGLGHADYEGSYLPDGNIVFNSTRCVQIVDCWLTEVSNLYVCDKDGKYLRRLSFDQVHTNYPTVMDDGRVTYTRWDYNDRGQLYPQPLFQMNPDGTGQTEFYGNNSWFPTTIAHARGIPGTQKVMAIFTGHHSRQAGKLGIIDPAKGRQEASGAQLIAPVRPTPAEKIDAYGQKGDLFQYPYPLSETQFLVSYAPLGKGLSRFGIYFMDADGRRELLASDEKIACGRMVPLSSRPTPHLRPSTVDYRKPTGTYYMQDIYVGPGLAGVPRGTIKKLRVVSLQYRVANIGANGNGGPAGGALVSMPPSINNGSWDVKTVLGSAKVYEDGSAAFQVPARTPLYFQALDAKGQVVQTMRTWSTLQPGEQASCVGCHEDKNNSVPTQYRSTMAMRVGPQRLESFYGPLRGFSFQREIQPILDRHCVRCHNQEQTAQFKGAVGMPSCGCDVSPADLKTVVNHKGETWRYTMTRPANDWTGPGFNDSLWPYGQGGFGTAGTPGAVVGTTWKTPEIWLRRTFELSADVRPQDLLLLAHHDEDVEIYLNGVLAAQESGFLTGYRPLPIQSNAAASLKPGKNTLAVHCKQTSGGQYIDVGIVARKTPEAKKVDVVMATPKPVAKPVIESGVKPAFGLKGTEIWDERAKRRWSQSYLALTQRGRPNPVVNWLNVQSVPPMLPPYFAGSATSKLMTMLEEGHDGVKLSQEEMEKIACWIDLLVPYCGDYAEASQWTQAEADKYNHYLNKRVQMEQLERENIEQWIGGAMAPSPLPPASAASPGPATPPSAKL